MIESHNSGATSYVRKPVDSDEFAAAVAQLRLHWAILNETPE
jgi:two-component system response regulator